MPKSQAVMPETSIFIELTRERLAWETIAREFHSRLWWLRVIVGQRLESRNSKRTRVPSWLRLARLRLLSGLSWHGFHNTYWRIGVNDSYQPEARGLQKLAKLILSPFEAPCHY